VVWLRPGTCHPRPSRRSRRPGYPGQRNRSPAAAQRLSLFGWIGDHDRPTVRSRCEAREFECCFLLMNQQALLSSGSCRCWFVGEQALSRRQQSAVSPRPPTVGRLIFRSFNLFQSRPASVPIQSLPYQRFCGTVHPAILRNPCSTLVVSAAVELPRGPATSPVRLRTDNGQPVAQVVRHAPLNPPNLRTGVLVDPEPGGV